VAQDDDTIIDEPRPAEDVRSLATMRRPVPEQGRGHVCMLVLSPARTTVHVRREAAALADARFAVTVIDIEQDHRLPADETVRGVRLQHVFVSPRSARHYDPLTSLPWLLFKVTRITRSALKVLTTHADAYHAHDITALPACYLAALLRRKPLVFDAHELPMTQKHLVHRRMVTGISQALLRIMMKRCTETITVSPPLVQEMKKLYGGPVATVVRNIPDYQQPVNDDRLRRHFGLPPSARITLYQGGFQANRSLDTLVRAAPFLAPGNVIVLMGGGESLAQLERLIAELGVEDRVKIKPSVPYQELLSWTTSADLGLCVFSPDESLSIRYCLPNKLFEYLMAGLPVLTTQLDAVVDLVRHYGVGGETASMWPETVAGAINALLADPVELARMRANALAACQTALRWDLEQQRLVDVYERILGTWR
jgi:glycosyltransferase involved in cell wall biosynthesis